MMRIYGREKKKASKYLTGAAIYAAKLNYPFKKSGALLVKRNHILGSGSLLSENKTLEDYLENTTKGDYCTHSAIDAINSALENFGEKRIRGSTIYYIDLDSENKSIPAKKPFCKKCSKEARDKGIKNWVLAHEKAIIYSYRSSEYHKISSEHIGNKDF
jgi:hypothetical protein